MLQVHGGIPGYGPKENYVLEADGLSTTVITDKERMDIDIYMIANVSLWDKLLGNESMYNYDKMRVKLDDSLLDAVFMLAQADFRPSTIEKKLQVQPPRKNNLLRLFRFLDLYLCLRSQLLVGLFTIFLMSKEDEFMQKFANSSPEKFVDKHSLFLIVILHYKASFDHNKLLAEKEAEAQAKEQQRKDLDANFKCLSCSREEALEKIVVLEKDRDELEAPIKQKDKTIEEKDKANEEMKKTLAEVKSVAVLIFFVQLLLSPVVAPVVSRFFPS